MRCRTVLLSLVLLAATACGLGEDSEVVRMILPHGDAADGRQAFIDLKCPACHEVAGVEGLPAVEAEEPGPDLAVSLRGQARGSIASSIMAPQHVNVEAVELWTDWTPEERVWLGPAAVLVSDEQERAPSRMRDYTAVLTVRQLTDLVTFLEKAADSR